MSFYETKDYKAIMAAALTGEGKRGELTRAAEFLNCQRSYLSRVLLEEMHLTTDHAFRLTQYFEYSTDERDYFLALVESERASSSDYRAYWRARADEIKQRQAELGGVTRRRDLSIDKLQVNYFASWTWSAIHFLVSIPEFQTPSAIAARLGLTPQVTTQMLEALQEQGLVEQSRGRWKYKAGEFHVDRSSPLVVFHHQNWRQRAVLDAQNAGNESLHYTAVQTMSRADADRIRARLMEFIREASQIAGPSTPEDAVALTLDFFRV